MKRLVCSIVALMLFTLVLSGAVWAQSSTTRFALRFLLVSMQAIRSCPPVPILSALI